MTGISMNEVVFIDTAAWFAGIAGNDQYNEAAMKHRARLMKEHIRSVKTNLVVHETTMLLERKVSKREAIRFLKAIIRDPLVDVVHVDEDTELEGYALYRKYKDQDYSIADCISFVVMRQHQISRCFTSDHHFSGMGFAVEPL